MCRNITNVVCLLVCLLTPATAMAVPGRVTFNVHERINIPLAAKFDTQVVDALNTGVREVVMDIDSPGGRLDITEAMIATMAMAQRNGVKFVCFARGTVSSGAFMLYMACDRRVASTKALFMWHETRMATSYIPLSVILRWAMEGIAHQAVINAWIAARMHAPFESIRDEYEREARISPSEFSHLTGRSQQSECTYECRRAIELNFGGN